MLLLPWHFPPNSQHQRQGEWHTGSQKLKPDSEGCAWKWFLWGVLPILLPNCQKNLHMQHNWFRPWLELSYQVWIKVLPFKKVNAFWQLKEMIAHSGRISNEEASKTKVSPSLNSKNLLIPWEIKAELLKWTQVKHALRLQ